MASKDYYQKNRARLLELARIYREKNREEINRKQRERYRDASTGYRDGMRRRHKKRRPRSR